MEIELPMSHFKRTPETIIVPTSDIETTDNSSYFHYKFKSSDAVDNLSEKVISKSYGLLDSISGYPSYFLSSIQGNYDFQPLHEVLGLLETKKIIKQGSFGGTRYNDAPFFYQVDIFPNFEKGVTDGRKIEKWLGHGFGKNAAEVFSKAIGEILERYPLTIYHKKNLLRSSLRSLKNKKIPALDLNLLDEFSEEQKKNNPKLRFSEESVFYWEKAKRVLTDEAILLPAQIAHWNYYEELEPFLGDNNTNGAGGFFTREGAILSGLYELIQRDSFLIFWLNGLTPRSIDPKTVPDEDFQNILAESERYGFEIYCLDITTDTGVPAFVVVISDPSGKCQRFSLGAGCQADPAKALHRALEEAWSIYYWIRPQPPCSALDKNYQPFREKIDVLTRLRLWANPEMAERFEFFISGPKMPLSDINFDYPKEFTSQEEELAFLVKRVESLGPGYEVYCYQAEHPILTEVGYYSVQVFVPEFIRIYFNETNAYLGKRRLKEVPPKLGFKAAEELNILPHPFP